MQPVKRGNVISLKNGTGDDATPYRFYAIDTTEGQFKAVSAGGDIVGILLPDLRYADGKVANGMAGSLQIDGVQEVDAGGTVTVADFVKADSNGKAVSAGALVNLSGGVANVMIAGQALESGSSGSRISIVIRPNVIPKA